MNPTPLGWCIFAPNGYDDTEYKVFIYEYHINGKIEYSQDYTGYPLRAGRDFREIYMVGVLEVTDTTIVPQTAHTVMIIDEDRLGGRTESFSFFLQKCERTLITEGNMVNGLANTQLIRVSISGILMNTLFWSGSKKPEIMSEDKRELMI